MVCIVYLFNFSPFASAGYVESPIMVKDDLWIFFPGE